MKNLLFILFFPLLVSAQGYLQVGVNAINENVKIVNLKEKGLLILEKDDFDILRIKKIDTLLHLDWELSAQISKKHKYLDNYFDGQFAYLVFQRSGDNALEVLKIATSIGVIQRVDLGILPNFTLTHFKAIDQLMVFGGIIKEEPFIVFFNKNSPIPKYFSINLKGQEGLQSIDILDNYLVKVCFVKTNKNGSEIIVRTYNHDGLVLGDQFLTAEQDREFLSAMYYKINEEEFIVGNFGNLAWYKEEIQNTQGIFLAKNLKDIKYYGLDQFKNFFNFLPQKQKEKQEERISKRKSKGKEFLFNYRLSLNDILIKDNEILISAEMFQPIFRSNNSPYGSSLSPLYGYSSFYDSRAFFYNPNYWMNLNSSSYRRNSRVFEGYKYLTGLVIGIDSTGKFKWDNSIVYQNIQSMDMKNHLKLDLTSLGHVVSYGTGRKYMVNTYKNDGQMESSVDMVSQGENLLSSLKKSEFNNFEHWYGEQFFNWGLVKPLDIESRYKQICIVQKIKIDK